MFARLVGTKSAILLEAVRRLFCSPAGVPTNSKAARDHTSTGLARCVPLVDSAQCLVDMVHCRPYRKLRGLHKHNSPWHSCTIRYYATMSRPGLAAAHRRHGRETRVCDVATELKREERQRIETAAQSSWRQPRYLDAGRRMKHLVVRSKSPALRRVRRIKPIRGPLSRCVVSACGPKGPPGGSRS